MMNEADQGATTNPSDQPEKPSDLRTAQIQWEKHIEDQWKDQDNFRREVERSIKWLRLNRDGRKSKASGDRLNISYSNYEILQNSTYSRTPKPVVVPRFGGGDNRQQLNAVAQVIERCVESNNERSDLHSTLVMCRDDLLKAGRGVPWLRYEADFTEQQMVVLDEATGQPVMGQDGVTPMQAPQKVKTAERVIPEFVGWQDYLEGPAKTWRQVPWVARRVTMNRAAFREMFGPDAELAKKVTFAEQGAMGKSKNVEGPVAEVWEIWDRESRKVIRIARNAHEALEVTDPPIQFDGFFPCPEPAMSATEDGNRTPVPQTLLIEDQLVEIDELTKRINALRSALRVRGFYPKGATGTGAADEIEAAVKNADDSQTLIPVVGWAAAGQASMKDMVLWLPIDIVVQTIQQCVAMRKESIELVYQVTGISDVMRGASEASETLGAQQIKAQWGSIRVRSKQGEMARLARDVCRMTAEIICELFDEQNIAEMAVYGYQQGMLEFMRDDRMRSLLLDVETDSTISPDEDADKARATEFVTALGGILQQGVQVGQVAPELVPLIGSTIKFMASKFRAGRELEADIDKAVLALTQRAMAPPAPPQPDPTEVVKGKAEEAKAQATIVRAHADVAKARTEAATASMQPAGEVIPFQGPAA